MEEQLRKPLQVLMVEDSAEDALLIEHTLKRGGYKLFRKRVATATEMRLALKDKAWDLIIADHSLPSFSGLEAFEIYRQHDLDIPFIIVSGAISEEIAVSAMKGGVHDYLSKNNLARLAPAVNRELCETETRRERRRAEDALCAAHEELAAIHANAPVALLVVDEELRVLKVNDMAAHLTAGEAGGMLGLQPGKGIDCLNALEDPKGCGHGPSCARCSLRGAALDTVHHGTRHTGLEKSLSVSVGGQVQTRNLLFSTVPLRLGDSRRGLICAQDITAIKQAAKEIQRQRDQLEEASELRRLAFEAAELGTWHYCFDTRKLFCDARCRGMLGMETDEQIDYQEVLMRIHPEDRNGVVDVIKQVSAGVESRAHHREFRIVWPDGSVHWLDSHARVYFEAADGQSQATRFIGVVADIGERKQAELQIIALNHDLDQRIEELRSALKQKNVLIKEVQHRVKNNLQVISSMVALESERFSGGTALKALEETRDRIRSMALIHDKFCHSTDLAQIHFADYVNSLASYFLNSYASDSNAIQLTTDVTVKLGMDDAIPCGLIIQELLSNSMKHAFPDSTGKIWIDFHRSGEELRLCYRDSGIGLPQRVDLRDPQSLGLQLVSDLVDQLRGHLEYWYADGAMFVLSFSNHTALSSLC
jgi:PAS domain S-box-containing protein